MSNNENCNNLMFLHVNRLLWRQLTIMLTKYGLNWMVCDCCKNEFDTNTMFRTCSENVPSLEDTLKSKIKIVAVSIDQDFQSLKKFIEEAPVRPKENFIIGIDPENNDVSRAETSKDQCIIHFLAIALTRNNTKQQSFGQNI